MTPALMPPRGFPPGSPSLAVASTGRCPAVDLDRLSILAAIRTRREGEAR
jgi:hypothetical protein